MKLALDGPGVLLNLPAAVARAFVFESDFKTGHCADRSRYQERRRGRTSVRTPVICSDPDYSTPAFLFLLTTPAGLLPFANFPANSSANAF